VAASGVGATMPVSARRPVVGLGIPTHSSCQAPAWAALAGCYGDPDVSGLRPSRVHDTSAVGPWRPGHSFPGEHAVLSSSGVLSPWMTTMGPRCRRRHRQVRTREAMVVLVPPSAKLPALLGRPKPRDLIRDDLPRVQSLLAVLPELYPEGGAWLDRRLDDVLAGRARCTLVEVDDVVAGVAIETPKAFDRFKLSTFLVADEYRNAGVGGSLIRFLHGRWVRDAVGQVHVTVAEHHHDHVRRAFAPVGFLTVAHEVDRYGPGRSEYVMTCLPTEDNLR
jgi:hypothetical protein